jgi:carbon monoxide dehydrogenase subunit G
MQAESTEVMQVDGTIASVCHTLLDTTSKKIIKNFFEKLAEAAVE